MCGILGMIGLRSPGICQTDAAMFVQMLHVGALRGMHGTGALAVEKNGGFYRAKVGGPPHQLFESESWRHMEKFVSDKSIRFMVGHNRYATYGKRITEHAHPFYHGDICLVHNGTLEGAWRKTLPDGNKFDVDSEAICNSIALQGVEKTMKGLRGAWTLVYYNKKDQTLNILRNSKRPLYMCRNTQWGMLAFASEQEMLYWIAKRNNWHNISGLDDIKMVQENLHMSWHIDDDKPTVKEIKGAADVSYNEGYWSQRDGAHDVGDAVGGKQQAEGEVSKVIALPPVPFKKTDRRAAGHLLTVKDSNTGGSSGGAASAGVGAIPFRSKPSYPNSESGLWQVATDLHDLAKGGMVEVEILDYVSLGKNEKDHFQLKGCSDAYPDIDFFCNIKGGKDVMQIIETGKMRGKIMSIQRSMVLVAKHPHKIFLQDPEPIYEADPILPETKEKAK